MLALKFGIGTPYILKNNVLQYVYGHI